jgi:cbb3-type cytochrome oxidase subunit 3
MTHFILLGDLLICGFMVALVVWLFTRGDKSAFDKAARIPLDDEEEENGEAQEGRRE